MLQLKVCLLPSPALTFRGRRTDTEKSIYNVNLVWPLISGVSASVAFPSHAGRERPSSSQRPQSAPVAVVLGCTAATFQYRVGSKGEILLQVQWAAGQQETN